MDVQDYVAACRAHLRLVTLVILAAVAAAVALWWIRPTVYESRVEFFASADGSANDASQAYQGGLFTQQRVLSYAQVVSSPAVAAAVIQATHLPMSPRDLTAELSASVPTNTAILDVRVQDRSAARAALVAQSLARIFPRVVALLEQPSGQSASPVRISVIGPPQRPTAPVSRHLAVLVAVGLIVGSVAAVALALVLDTDRRRRRRDATYAAMVAAQDGHVRGAHAPITTH